MLSHFKYGILLNSFKGSIRFRRPNYVMMTSRLIRGQLESNLSNIFLFGRLFRRKSYHIFTSYSSNWFLQFNTCCARESWLCSIFQVLHLSWNQNFIVIKGVFLKIQGLLFKNFDCSLALSSSRGFHAYAFSKIHALECSYLVGLFHGYSKLFHLISIRRR